MKPEKKIQRLFNRYLNNQCSDLEIELLLQYFDAQENQTLLKSLIKKALNATGRDYSDSSGASDASLNDIYEKIKAKIRP